MAKSKYFTAADFKKPKTQTATKSKYFTAADFAKGTEASTTSKSKYFTAGDFAENIANNAINRINALNDNATTLVKDYESRFGGRKGNYEDAYVSDSADYLNTVAQQRDAYKQEYNDILSYLDKNAKYLNPELVDSVKKSLTENDVASVYDQVVKAAEEDNAYWNSFGDGLSNKILKYATFGQYDAEAAYKTEQRQYGYYQKYQGKSAEELNTLASKLENGAEKNWLTKYAASVENDELSKADIGVLKKELEDLKKEKAAYLEDRAKKREEEEENKSFWEKIGSYLGTTPDTTIPLGGVSQTNGSTVSNPYDKLISEKEQQIASATYIQGYEGFMDNMDATDYATGSQYVSTRTNVPLDDAKYTVNYGDAVGDQGGYSFDTYNTKKLFGDFLYDYINKNKDALTVASSNDAAYYDYFLGHDKGFLQTMKDEEIGVFNYLYKKNKEDAYAYLDFLESDLQGRRRIQEQAKWAEYAKENPVESSVFSTLISPLKGLTYINQAADMLDDGKMQENAGYNRFSYIPSTIRSQVSSTIEDSGNWGKVGSFAYNTGMSMADFVWTTGVSGGNQALALGIMGSGAAADTTLAAKDRGLGDVEAFTLGTIAGVAEVAMERISLGAWLEGDMSEGAFRYLLKNSLSESGEELGTSLINFTADTIIAADKSELRVAMQEYLDSGKAKTEAEAFGLAIADQAGQIGLDALGGFLSGAAIGGGTYAGTSTAAQFQYGDIGKNKTQAQKLVAEGMELNPTSKYVQKAQSKVEKGKNLTGMQVRNILAANQEKITANDMQKIQKAAEQRLTSLGQTENVSEVAEIATKWATGQDLTRAEKKLLTHSQYGSRVANELLPENIASENYATDWAEEIGTESVNKAAYNKKAIRTLIDAIANAEDTTTYKSLEERVGTESRLKVSKDGQATIGGEAVDLHKAEVVDFVKDKKGNIVDMTVKVDGKEVKASEIDYADGDQSYLFEAVSKIENITPADATVIIRDYDPSSGLSVSEYLNGVDEAYTYGYHNYSEADMKAGKFAPNLTETQMKTAYVLGQNAKKISGEVKAEAFKRMRTAVEAEAEKAKADGKKVPKSKKMTVAYDRGNGETVEFSKAEMKKLSGEQRAGVAIAKILHKLGLGTNFEFFSSYLSDNIKVKDKKTGEMKAARVYVDENGAEVAAPAGVYKKSDGTIRIDLNAYNGKKLTLYAMAHELTHFIQQWSDTKYQELAEFLIKTYDKTDMSMHQRVIIEQARLQEIRGKEVSYDEAFDEVVANAMMKMLDDQNIAKTLAELKAQDANLAQKLISKIKELIDDFINALKEYKQYPYLFDDTKDIMALEKEFEQLKQMWAEALVEASENFQAAQTIGFEMDAKTESVSPAVMRSEQTWTESDYVQQRDKAAQEIAKAIGVSQKKAKDYIDSINSIAKMIAEDRSRLDYFSSPYRSSFVDNAEYGGSFDFSTLCKKRRLLTGTFTAIQKALPNTALTANEILDIRNRMKDAGLEVSCGLCYVEGSRANMGQFAKEFLRLYKQYYPDAWQPNMADVNTPDGIEWVRLNHPECYEQYEYFWNHYGTLKPGDKNLFASQQKPKLYQLHTEYKGEILNKFKNDDKVEDKNLNGGIRLQSFSDFEIVHLIDTMQIIMDMSRVGLAGQAYTKVPDFAWALGDTGLKINLSLIAKGVDENGKLIFDDVEGMPIAEAMKLRDRYSKNVGTILVAFNDEQLLAAMADDRVDFIIPFHRSQWKKSQYEAMGLPAKTKDYTYMQNEKFIKPQYHEYRGRMVKDKATNYMPNEYWDFSKSGKENAEAYLEMCARNNKRPKFYKLLQNNGDGSYSLKADGSTDGYWKLLIDFKMYDNDGVGSPQMAVKPEFNMDEATRMLNDYSGGHSNFPVAQGIVDGFVKDYKASHKGEQYSSQETDADNAPIFYSKMGKVVEGMKQEKFGASSVISMLTGRGVKAEEIRWSGIHAFLDGKKSVTKAELQEFIAGSQLNIEEKVLDGTKPTNTEVKKVGWNKLGAFINGELITTYTKGKDGWYESEKSGWHEIKNKKDLEELLAYKSKYLVGNKQRHSAFKLDGGKNYREVVFAIPGSSYSNPAMVAHWGKNAQGILAHARIQDFDVDGQKMLFVEEIQSDWHNEGHKQGYIADGQKFDSDIRNESADAYRDFYQSKVMQSVESKLDRSEYGGNVTKLISDLFDGDKSAYSDVAYYANLTTDERAFIDNAIADENKRQQELNKAPQASKKDSYVPDAPFKDNYHEFVLKRLLREAAEKGYDSIGWTTADIQSQRWSDEFAEGYRIEYDQDIPKFLKKYGKQWGAEVGKSKITTGELSAWESDMIEKGIIEVELPTSVVWSMDITPAMKKSVLTEGQEMYSTQETDIDSNRAMLANAFEGLSQNSEEYKMIQEYKEQIKVLNLLEDQLAKLNAQIWEIRFTKGKYDAEKLRKLEEKAKRIAKDINKQDKTLLNMEASAPLRKVIEFERKKASQKIKEHVEKIQQNKKVRAEQTELRHKIRKAVRDLDKLLNRGNKKTNVKEDMKDFVSKALELADYLFTDHISNDDLIRKGITVRMTDKEAALVKETEDILSQLYDNADSLADEEFARLDAKRKANEDKLRDLLTAQRNERLNTPVSKLFDDLVKAYASLKNSKQDAVKAAYSEELENSLRAMTSEDSKVKILENMRVADMTTEELNWLYRAYTMVLTNVRNANKAFADMGAATIEEISNKVSRDFSSRKIPEGKLAIAMQKLTNKIGWDYEKLYYALDRIGSEAFTELIMNLANSENIVMQDVKEAIKFRDNMVKEYGFNNWAVNKEIDKEFLDNTGKKFKLTLGQLMALYAYSRRDGAWDHIEYGGFVFGEASLTNPKPADAYKLTKAQCEAITDTLTKEQKAYVRDMQKYLSETMGKKGNEVSMLLYGIKMFGEENYFPIHIAGQFKTQANESQAKAAAGFSTMSNAGFTHAQNPNAKAPFVLEGFNEIWVDHVNEMSRYHGTVPALEDIRRVMNRSSYSDAAGESVSIKQQMENSFGKEAVDYFDNLYREANSGAITDKLQKLPKKLLSLFRKNSVAYSWSVLIQQPASIVRAYAMIDRKYFGVKGFGTITSGVVKTVSNKWTNAQTKSYNEMLKYAPGVTMAKEIGGFDTATGGSIRSYLLDTKKSFKQSMKTENLKGKTKAVLDLVDDNAIANLPNVADKIAWIEIWNACKRETVAKHKDLATSSNEFMQIVGDRFTEVIRATQVYDSIFSKSPMLKSKNLAVQYLVSFMNEPNTVANMAESAVRDVKNGNWKSGARTAHVVIHSIIFTNVLKSIIYAMRDDDEDETYIEKYIESITSGLMNDFWAPNYIPIARDVWSLAQGYDVGRADMAIVADALDALNRVIQNATTETGDMTEDQLIEFDKKCTEANWKLAESLASFFGIPVKNIRREVEGVIDHARIASANAGMTTSESFWDKVKDGVAESIPGVSVKSKTDKIYNAIVSGDDTYLERLKGTYKDDDAYHTAVRKALRENDPRIKEAAQARYDGNTEEYKRIFRKIQNEGNFAFDDIMSAVNSELSAIKNKLEPDKATSQNSTGDFVEAVVMGNTINAEAMRDDIIAAKVADGKTQEEAEKEFASNVGTDIGKAYSSGLLDEAQAEKLLVEYAGKDEEEAASRVNYWAFCEEHQEYKDVLTEANVNDYQEFADPAEISLDVYAQYISGTKGLETIKDEWGDVEVSKRDQVLEVIDSLPITSKQKDALYLAAGYSESKIWDVPW